MNLSMLRLRLKRDAEEREQRRQRELNADWNKRRAEVEREERRAAAEQKRIDREEAEKLANRGVVTTKYINKSLLSAAAAARNRILLENVDLSEDNYPMTPPASKEPWNE